VAALPGPWPTIRAPWRVSEHPPTPGAQKTGRGQAARALALFYTVGFT